MAQYSLIGIDSNAFYILAYVAKAMKKENCSQQEIENYRQDAESDDYQHLLFVSQEMINKLNEKKNAAAY